MALLRIVLNRQRVGFWLAGVKLNILTKARKLKKDSSTDISLWSRLLRFKAIDPTLAINSLIFALIGL